MVPTLKPWRSSNLLNLQIRTHFVNETTFCFRRWSCRRRCWRRYLWFCPEAWVARVAHVWRQESSRPVRRTARAQTHAPVLPHTETGRRCSANERGSVMGYHAVERWTDSGHWGAAGSGPKAGRRGAARSEAYEESTSVGWAVDTAASLYPVGSSDRRTSSHSYKALSVCCVVKGLISAAPAMQRAERERWEDADNRHRKERIV